MTTLPETIIQEALSLSVEGIISSKEFLHLGSRSAVSQAFSHLAKIGKLQRVTPTPLRCLAGSANMRLLLKSSSKHCPGSGKHPEKLVTIRSSLS